MVPSTEHLASFLSHDPHHNRILLTVHLQPGAKSDAIFGLHGGALKIRIAAPAVDNKANTALVAFLSKWVGVPERHISILSGLRARRKRIAIVGRAEPVMAQLRTAISNVSD